MSFRTRCLMDNLDRPPSLYVCDSLPRDVTARALSRRLLLFFSFSHLIPIRAMRSKASKRPLSTAPTSAGESDDDGISKKRVRWESRSDNGEMGAVTAPGEFDGTGEEGSTAPDSEKVRLSLQHREPP